MAVSSFGKCGMQYKKTCTESYTLFPECVLNCWCLNSLMYKLNLHFGETKFLFSSLDSANLLCLSYFPFKFDFANSHVEGTGCLIAKWKYYLNASLPLCHLTDSCLIPSSWKIKVFFFFWLRHYFCFVSLLDILCNTYSGLPTSSKCLSIEINATWRLVISNVDSSKLEILMADILYLLPVYDFKKNLFCFKDKPFFIYYLKEEKKNKRDSFFILSGSWQNYFPRSGLGLVKCYFLTAVESDTKFFFLPLPQLVQTTYLCDSSMQPTLS